MVYTLLGGRRQRVEERRRERGREGAEHSVVVSEQTDVLV
jgi:hypothetical protein